MTFLSLLQHFGPQMRFHNFVASNFKSSKLMTFLVVVVLASRWYKCYAYIGNFRHSLLLDTQFQI